MNLPNKLTMFRVILVPVFLIFLLYDLPCCEIISLVVFVVASLTDLIDGKIARKHNLVTNFGKFADPLADKLLVSAALIAFCSMGELNPWFCFIIIAREFIVTGLRIVAISSGTVIAAGMSGKIKTVLQMIGLSLMLFDRIYTFAVGGVKLSFIVMAAAVVMTVYSGAEYIIKNINMIDYRS
jgi:CDP-diacylglycerol--glycerol-3-phosphate 3-phosphatidyltransferase